MKKITTRMITDRFIELFEKEQPFTLSEKRMFGIKMKQLRKSVDDYVASNNIETDLSTNEIIMDAIEYSALVGKKFRSISSIGYDVLPKSINYWRKRRILEEMAANQKESKQPELVITPSDKVEQKTPTKKVGNWMNIDDW